MSQEERMKKLKENISKKSKASSTEFAKLLATREKLERDYKEDYMYVTFYSSPEIKRTILARRPNQEEFLKILSLIIAATKYEDDPDSLEKLKEVYSDFHKIAASLCIDKKLDEEFWSKSVSFDTLQNFITEVINESQKSAIPEDELKSFRKK